MQEVDENHLQFEKNPFATVVASCLSLAMLL